MNFQTIKTKFILHLKETAYDYDKTISSLDTSDMSIFSHQEEFKQFLKDEYNIVDSSLAKMSVSDIMQMNIVDGKLVDKFGDNVETEEKQEGNQEENAAEGNNEAGQNVEAQGAGNSETPENTENTENSENVATSENPETVENPEAPENTENSNETPTEENTENGWLSGFINDLFGNETFKNNVDVDKNGEVNEEELGNFLNYIKDLDGAEDSVSLDDIFATLEAMENGTFNMEASQESDEQASQTPENTDTTTDTTDNTDASSDIPDVSDSSSDSSDSSNYTPTVDNSSSSSGSHSSSGGSGDYSGSDNSGGDTTTPTPDNQTPKTLENMTEDELNQELNTAKTGLETNKATLNAISDGSYEGNEDFKKLKSDMDEAYKAYKEGIDPEQAQELDKITTDIANKENEIAQKEVEIAEQNLKISEAETAYNSALASYESYKSAVDELQNQKNDENLTDEQKAEIGKKLSDAEAKRDAAQDDVGEKEKALKAEQEKLTQLNEQLNQLKTGEGGLEALNKQKEDLETKIKEKNPSATDLITAYNNAKAAYDAKKTELKDKAISDIKASQDRINEVNTAKNNLETKTDIDNNLKFKSTPDLFASDSQLNMEYIKGGAMNYLLISPKNVDPNAELPVMVFLHGSGEVGGGEGATYKQFCPGGFMKNWGLNAFNGYVLVPVLPKGSSGWGNSKSEKNMRSILNDFCNTHKVNKDKISLAGASLGGQGAVYLAGHMQDVFYRTAALSAYSSDVDPKSLVDSQGRSRIRGYYGSRDDHSSINYMKKAFSADTLTSLKGAEHCDVPKTAFGQDLDGDKCSDLIQWLFAD